MARFITVTVRHGPDAYRATIEPDERADQLLLRSLYHFGLDPHAKRRYRLVPRGDHRPAHGLYLDHPIGDQVEDGAELVLEADLGENRRLATGTY